MIWISFYFLGVAASKQWLNWTLSGAVLLVLLFIASTRLTENISCSKYTDYKAYQKNVSRFFFLQKEKMRDFLGDSLELLWKARLKQCQ